MKLSRVLAASAGVALIGASTIAFAAPASAADIIAPQGSTFPDEADFDSYPSQWFVGESGNTAPLANSLYGLDITATGGTAQILNGTPITGSLIELTAYARVIVTRGEATFQISVFGEPTNDADPEFTTLRPVEANYPVTSPSATQTSGPPAARSAATRPVPSPPSRTSKPPSTRVSPSRSSRSVPRSQTARARRSARSTSRATRTSSAFPPTATTSRRASASPSWPPRESPSTPSTGSPGNASRSDSTRCSRAADSSTTCSSLRRRTVPSSAL